MNTITVDPGEVTRNMEVILLGSGASLPPQTRENTSLAIRWEGGLWLIDCGASPHRRLRLAGLEPGDLSGVLLTHAHPDHLYGLPSLIHCLAGDPPRRAPLDILAPAGTLKTARDLLEVFHLLARPEVPLQWRTLPPRPTFPEGEPVWEERGMRIWTAPVRHGREAVGVRLEAGGRAVAYSGDTEPCPEMVMLAQGAHLLVHEATRFGGEGEMPGSGHSTAAGAGRVAAEAGAGALVLVHLRAADRTEEEALLEEARGTFNGPIALGQDLGRYPV